MHRMAKNQSPRKLGSTMLNHRYAPLIHYPGNYNTKQNFVAIVASS